MNNREEILAKSRNENKDQDIFEKEVSIKAGNIAACAAAILATLFFVIQILVGGGMNYGLYAIIFSIPAAGYIVKALTMKRKPDVVLAIIWTVAAIILSVVHIAELIRSSTIL